MHDNKLARKSRKAKLRSGCHLKTISMRTRREALQRIEEEERTTFRETIHLIG
jgi:hypothetical protein